MKGLQSTIALPLALIALALVQSSRAAESTSSATGKHVMLTPDEITWKPFPALGPGIQLAILSGDPFRVRLALRLPHQDARWRKSSAALASRR